MVGIIYNFMAKKTMVKKSKKVEGKKMESKHCSLWSSVGRQGTLLTGFLVSLGYLLGFYHDPMWHFLSGVVGIVLMISAVSGCCVMSYCCSKMPWNKDCKNCE